MITFIRLFIFYASIFVLSAQSSDEIISVRDLYFKADQSYNAIIKLKKLANIYTSENDLMLGYIWAAHMLEAKHITNPINKYQHFIEGKEQLEKIILRNKRSIELRFLRYTLQIGSPSFLNYNSEIIPDKAFIKSNLEMINDVDLKKRIILFLANYS